MSTKTQIIISLEDLKINHYECPDPFYSCSIIETEWISSGICDCGAEKHNKKVDNLIEVIKKQL